MSMPASIIDSKKRSDAPQECLNVFQVVFLWIQPQSVGVVRLPERVEGLDRTEARRLRAEIGPAEKEDVDRVADARVDLFEVGDADLDLPLEDLVHDVRTARGQHVPFGDVAHALGVGEVGAGNEGDVAERGVDRARRRPRIRPC